MGVTNGYDAAKIGKNNHFLLIMRVRILQKIGLLDLTNRTQLRTILGALVGAQSAPKLHPRARLSVAERTDVFVNSIAEYICSSED